MIFSVLSNLFFLVPLTLANIPENAIILQMDETLRPLGTRAGWQSFLATHKNQCPSPNSRNPLPKPVVTVLEYHIGRENVRLGMGCRSEFIAAVPKTIVGIVNSPQYFQDLNGLDKPANITPVTADGQFKARIYKLVPGIETQDYTLNYTSHWEEASWIQRAVMEKDERKFAIRDNIKIIEPSEGGAVFTEVSLFFPMRWWAKFFINTINTITISELGKLNRSFKCAAERVQNGATMNTDLAKSCFKEATR